jgi:hypothetical protein
VGNLEINHIHFVFRKLVEICHARTHPFLVPTTFYARNTTSKACATLQRPQTAVYPLSIRIEIVLLEVKNRSLPRLTNVAGEEK